MSAKLINGSEVGGPRNPNGWQPRHLWPDGTKIQFSIYSNGDTFIEVFTPDLFLRRDGINANIQSCEDAAWHQHTKYTNCSGHDWQPEPGYNNGMGRCTKCSTLKGNTLPPTKHCATCGIGLYEDSRTDEAGNTYCSKHRLDRPERLMTRVEQHHKVTTLFREELKKSGRNITLGGYYTELSGRLREKGLPESVMDLMVEELSR